MAEFEATTTTTEELDEESFARLMIGEEKVELSVSNLILINVTTLTHLFYSLDITQ